MSDSILYVYGFVAAGAAMEDAPAGLEGTRVALVREGGVAAIVSRLPAEVYARERVEALVGDVAWLGERAVAHDGVVTWASGRGGVVPVPMLTLFSDDAALRAALSARGASLEEALRRVARGEEYGVRLFRRDAELAGHLATLSPELSRLEAQARDATPGQRYLLERKLEALRTAELRRVAREAAAELYDALAPLALEAVREPLPRGDEESESGLAALNAYFLVARGELDPFRRALTELAARWEPRGFRVEFTGPWPPYHFAGTAA